MFFFCFPSYIDDFFKQIKKEPLYIITVTVLEKSGIKCEVTQDSGDIFSKRRNCTGPLVKEATACVLNDQSSFKNHKKKKEKSTNCTI